MPTPIYLDYNATTPVDPQALDAMLPFFRDHFGNASSEHSFGWTADEAVKQARERTARLIGATPRTMVFTSGATESNNLALRGVLRSPGSRVRSPESGGQPLAPRPSPLAPRSS